MDLVFSTEGFIILDNYNKDQMLFVAYEIGKSEKISYDWNAVTTYDVERIISELFEGSDYDIEDIIEKFRVSKLYTIMKENEDEED